MGALDREVWGGSHRVHLILMSYSAQYMEGIIPSTSLPSASPLALVSLRKSVWVQPVLDTVRLSPDSPSFLKFYQKTMGAFPIGPRSKQGMPSRQDS